MTWTNTFRNYEKIQFPDRDYMLTFLATQRLETLQNIITNAIWNRANDNYNDDKEFKQ